MLAEVRQRPAYVRPRHPPTLNRGYTNHVRYVYLVDPPPVPDNVFTRAVAVVGAVASLTANAALLLLVLFFFVLAPLVAFATAIFG